MNRKQFILSHGATCSNWTWSWSFVNNEKRFVIFGAWDVLTENNRSVILKDDWESNVNNGISRKQAGYTQALKHIELITQGYKLFTFPMEHSDHQEREDQSIIEGFTPILTERYLRREGDVWYAYNEANVFPDEITVPESYIEGAKNLVTVNSYERDPRARQACIEYYGTVCRACEFDFEKVYGEHGKGFIHVHHIKPLHTLGDNYKVDPIIDLIPLCPNCHAMVHRGSEILSIEKLVELIHKD